MKEKIEYESYVATDAETGEHYWDRREVKRLVPEESDRIDEVLNILKGSTTPEEVRKKYRITSLNSIYTWIGKYVSANEVLSLQDQTEEEMAKKSKDDQIRELKAALKKARKEAEIERLRAHAYDTMINLAEETFNIPIRKNLAPNSKSASQGV